LNIPLPHHASDRIANLHIGQQLVVSALDEHGGSRLTCEPAVVERILNFGHPISDRPPNVLLGRGTQEGRLRHDVRVAARDFQP
jgi:hypothetical protein